MKRNLAGLAAILTALVIQTRPVPADACGVKLTIKTQGPRKASTSVRAKKQQPIVAARVRRTPIAAGPTQPKEKTLVDAKQPAAEPTPPPPPPPEKVAKADPPPPAETKVAPEPKTRVEAKVQKPVEETVAPAPKKIAFAEEVHFTRGGYRLNGSATGALSRDAKWLAANPDAGLIIEGHADPSGDEDANMALSQKRAEAVRDYLVGKGVDGSRLEVAAFGETRLKYGETDSRNRRVMLVRKE